MLIQIIKITDQENFFNENTIRLFHVKTYRIRFPYFLWQLF